MRQTIFDLKKFNTYFDTNFDTQFWIKMAIFTQNQAFLVSQAMYIQLGGHMIYKNVPRDTVDNLQRNFLIPTLITILMPIWYQFRLKITIFGQKPELLVSLIT